MSDTATLTTTSAPGERPRRRRGLLFPLLLIVVGALLLAAEYGYLPPLSVRALLSLWPLLLILPGVEMIVARRQPYLALVIELLIVVFAIGVAATQPRGLFVPPASGASSSATVARETSRSLALRLEGGAGDYTLRGGASALVEATSQGGEISVRTDRRGDLADVRVQPAGFAGDVVIFPGVTPPLNVDVRVASDVPLTSLRVDGGAGDFTLDLRDVPVRDVRIQTGASKVELTLPHPSGDVPVRIEAGAATLTIVVPDDVEARITTTGGLVTTTTLNARLGSGSSSAVARSGSSVETAGYAAAKDRVTLTIQAGASSITIR